MAIIDSLPTDVYEDSTTFRPPSGSAYVLSESHEDRSTHVHAWEKSVMNVRVIRLIEDDAGFHTNINGVSQTYLSRNKDELTDFWKSIRADRIILDITGMSHAVWAPLLRTTIESGRASDVVYVEPNIYRQSPAPTEGEIFDLSERIKGISPIPGFLTLLEVSDERVCFVPLLGFEGTRFRYLLETVQPPGNNIVPIVGVPGFRIEYPFTTYLANRLPLSESHAWRNIRFASATCPFSAYHKLAEIATLYRNHVLKIAPIGTKPHALGAVIFAIKNPKFVELVYDHPIRKAHRTAGISTLHLYRISEFM